MKEYIGNSAFPDKIRQNMESLTEADEMAEFMFLGLRMTEGVSMEAFAEYFGKNISPFYEKYGSTLHLGDPFYRASRYNKTSLILYIVQKEFVTCLFSWNFHFLKGYPLGHQQLLQVQIDIDKLTFKH